MTDWLAVASSADSGPEETAAALREVLAADPRAGRGVVFDILAAGPHLEPERGLLVDPTNDAYRRWRRRVLAARTLLDSPAGDAVAAELHDEIHADPRFAAAVHAVGGEFTRS